MHRDLKPGNILIDSDEQPHITDFGLAKQMGSTTKLTRTQAIVGTPSYMAPEQALGNNADVSVATDIYGVGAILYAMLAGEAPFNGSSSMDVLRQVIETSPRKLDSSIVTADLKVICEKCLSKNPSDRYQSAGELASDLQRYLSGEPIIARPLGRAQTAIRWARRNPAVASFAVAASAMLLFALVSISLLLRSEHKARVTAEVNNSREQNLNKQIQKSLISENSARRRTEQNLSDAYANYGYAAQRRNRPNQALLWFCEASRNLPEESAAVNRDRIAAWMNRIPLPVFATHEKGMTLAAFDQSNRWLLCYREDQSDFHVFNLQTGSPVHLELEHSPTAVAWGNQPGRLWVGDSVGNVLSLDCGSGDLEVIAKVSEAVSCLDESTDGSKLAIGFMDRLSIYDLRQRLVSKRIAKFPAALMQVQFCCDDRKLLARARIGMSIAGKLLTLSGLIRSLTS